MDKQDSLLASERKFSSPLLALTAVLTVSGYATYGWSTHTVWAQWTYLLHTLVGIASVAVLIGYLIIHFRRTVGYRRPGIAFSGFLAALVFLAVTGSGIHVVLEGQREADRWIYQLHLVSATAMLCLLLAHIALHRLLLPAKRNRPGTERFPSITMKTWRATGVSVLVSAITVAIATAAYDFWPSPYRDEPAIKPYIYSYGEHPFRPSQTETSSGGFLDAKRVGGSRQCAACHGDIAVQWKSSIHAQAASDKTYQTNINLLSERRGMPATRYCEGCHAPVALLSGQLTDGGRLDTVGHMQEGVGCLGCHGIDRIEHVKGVASYRFAPPSPYLFEGSEEWLATLVHNFVIRLQPKQHRADLARDVLATPELCATCHAQFMDKDFNGWGWVKMQDDYTAWLNGPYSGQTHQTYTNSALRRCQDCHFPPASGKDPSANREGMIKTHFNAGANTAIPWFTGDQQQLLRTIRFLQADRIRISLDKPNRPDATETLRHIDPKVAESRESPAYFYLGEQVAIKVAVTNAQVGHGFPGGTTDINEAWIHFMVNDSQGNRIYESGTLDAEGNVEPDAYFYKSTPIDRLGNDVWRHDLFNMVGDSFKRVIPPGGTDITSFSFRVPDWTKGPLTVTADLNYRKLNSRYAKWALKDQNIQLPIVVMATDSLTLTVKTKPEVTIPLARD